MWHTELLSYSSSSYAVIDIYGSSLTMFGSDGGS